LILQTKVYYKGKRVDTITELVEMDNNLDFLLHLEKAQLEKLVSSIRDRVDQVGELNVGDRNEGLIFLISVYNH